MLILYGPDGSVLASDDNSAGDGRNARITYPATEAGVYTVEVLPSPLTPSPTSGEYVLSLTGNTGIAPFTVTSTSLAANSLVVSLSSITVDFSNPIYLPSLSNSSLTVDGIAATGFTVNNDHEVVFTLPALSSTGHDVKHKIQIGSTLQDIQGKALEGFSECTSTTSRRRSSNPPWKRATCSTRRSEVRRHVRRYHGPLRPLHGQFRSSWGLPRHRLRSCLLQF